MSSSNTPRDNYGTFGPDYSFADNIPLPGQIGVRTEASIGAIIDSVAGVNTYVDIIAFGGPTFFDKQNTRPMGIRYFLDTGMRCDNGATMSEYFDGITKGDLLGERVANALESAGLPGLKGLAPGMLENARDALDPRPIFSAITGTGYPVCQQVECPVGDIRGSIKNPSDENPFILDPVQWHDGMAWQTRWVQAYDKTGAAKQLSKDEFAVSPKCYNADGTYMEKPNPGCPSTEPAAAAGKAGTGKFKLCRVIHTPSAAPSVTSKEGFLAATEHQAIGVLMATLLLGGLALLVALHKK
jgi:hypothetical protein